MQLAGLAREKFVEEKIALQFDGSICLLRTRFMSWLNESVRRYSSGWSKEYREKDVEALYCDLIALLCEWQLARVDAVTGMVCLLPSLGRYSGRYPDDYQEREEGCNGG